MSNRNGMLTLALGAGGGLALWYLLRGDKRKPSPTTPAPITSAATHRQRALHFDSTGLAYGFGGPAAWPSSPVTDPSGRTVIDPYGRDSTCRGIMHPAMGGKGQVARRSTPWPHCSEPSSINTTTSPRACMLCLDPGGLTANGARVSIADAVACCQAAGRADISVVEGAPAQTYADLMIALGRAGIPASAQRNARTRRRSARTATEITGESSGILEPARNAETSRQFTLITYTQGLKASPRLRWFRSDSPVTWADARDRLGAARILDLQLAGRTREPGGWMLSIDPRHFRADRAEPLPGDSDG